MIVDLAKAPRDVADNGGSLVYLSQAGGLTQFGVNIDTLMPGAVSSDRHWHTAEDEFLYVLDGTATVIDDDGAHALAPGDACCWPHGDPNAHHLHNKTDVPLSYLIVGSRVAQDICHYPDYDEKQVNGTDDWQVLDANGTVLREGKLPPHLRNLPPVWGTPFDPARPARRILRVGDVTPISGTSSTDAFDNLGDYQAVPLSDAGGLTQFAAFTETLMPGAQSSQRHWHAHEDEFLYVLDGTVTLIENDGPHSLHPGDCACWPAGDANAHCLRNDTDTPVTYLIAGSRMPDDTVHYPDIDLHYTRKGGIRMLTHKDGTPYPGWPKETTR
jgi:uncharacterized cupin superfamily protein